jgi:hypothetical protein
MEINKPDSGIFRGLGNNERAHICNRKYFPNLRNIHNFQYTHGHRNDYKTTMKIFSQFDPNGCKYLRVRKNANESQM